MKICKTSVIYGITGVLAFFTGIRDIYFPGFFSISLYAVSKFSIATEFVLGVIFLGLAFLYAKAGNANRTTSA